MRSTGDEDERYRGSPVYFSDVVVRRDSRFDSFAALQGSWAYNERRFHSGYNVVRHHLSRLGEKSGYFASAVESGAHQLSLKMILDREVDASAIDSTVLEAEMRRVPELGSEIRIIEALGPSPMPPWVIGKNVQAQTRGAVSAALLDMHNDPCGLEILEQWGISRFAASDDPMYDPIRRMAKEAEDIRLSLSTEWE